MARWHLHKRGTNRGWAIAGICLLTLFATSARASASRPHEFTSTFGEHCIAAPCEGAALKEPTSVAVNEATGEVYVLDAGEASIPDGRVARFDKAGVFLSEFNGSGLLAGEESAAGGLKEPGELETGRFEAPNAIAVDNSCVLRKLTETELTQKQCEEEDPSNGDVYVVDAGEHHRVIDKYSADGKYLGQINGAGSVEFPNRALDGVAVDPKGTVWVYREEPAVIDRFTNETPNKFLEPQIAVNNLAGSAGPGFAVDSNDNFYGRLFIKGVPQITKWDPAGNVLIEALDGEGSSAVAVEQTSDAAIVDSATSLGVFNAEGAEQERLGEEHGESHLQAGAGIGVNAIEGFLYVTDPSAGPVVVFGPSKPSPPKVEGESFAEVGAHEASIAAQINPRSEAGEGPTEYHFSYGRCTSATTCASSAYEASIPIPEGKIAPDFEAHAVSAKLEGLSPATTYHFRVLAHNELGPGEAGEEESFTTEGEGGELTLADNRGWELVSPPDKKGARIEPIAESGVVQAAAGGGGITYLANLPTEAEPEGYTNNVQVLSRRSAGAWSSRDIAIAHSSATGKGINTGPEYKAFDRELEMSAVQPFGQFIPQLSPEASEATAYLHDLSDSCGSACFHPLVTGKAPFANVPEGTAFGEEELCTAKAEETIGVVCGPEFLGASEDLRHVVVKASVALTPGAEPIGGLYEWSAGKLAAVSVLPGAEAAAGESDLGQESASARGAVSADGSRVVWFRKGNLYLRDMAVKETVALDQAQPGCGSCASGGGRFQIASSDGSRVLFTDANRLSEDAGAENNKPDLYECRIGLSAGKLSCNLSDLTPVSGSESADVLSTEGKGAILGASADASTVYFVATGVLSEEANARGQKAQAGQPNLYVHRGGETEFIASLAAEDEHDWAETLLNQPTRVTGNGGFLELMSAAPLSGYDNRDRESGRPAAEVYLYDAVAKRLVCASCVPSGARPSGVVYEKLEPGNGGIAGGGRGTWQPTGLVAANVPGWTANHSGPSESRYQPAYLNNEGRLFFNSADALVPQDANSTEDVYEYEPPGVGGCSESLPTYSARSGGCVSLISSGSSAQESAFMDASESGDDVYFLTSAKLSPLDVDAARDVYDAHVCSSASPCISFPTTQTPPCTNEASCKASPTPQPSIFGAPASASFEGAGNLAPPPASPPPRPKKETRAQKLAKALKACKKFKHKRKRLLCQKQARKKYGVKAKPKAKGKKR